MRSRHVPQVCPSSAADSRLGQRTTLIHRTEDIHRRQDRCDREGDQRRPQKRADSAALHPRLFDRGGGGQGQLPDRTRSAATGQRLRRDPGPEVRLLDERARDHGVRLPVGPGALPRYLSRAGRDRRGCGPAGVARGDRDGLLTRSTGSAARPSLLPGVAINRTVQAILRGKRACCSPWPPAPARRSWRFRSAGSCGARAGTEGEDRCPRSSTWPTGTSWSTIPRTRSSRRSATRTGRSEWPGAKAGRSTSRSTRPLPRTSPARALS